MTHYTTLSSNLRRGILSFSKSISSGLLRPEFKFVSQMLFGILSSQSCQLSKIARSLDEKILLKKTIDRLSVNLATFTKGAVLFNNYIKRIKRVLNERAIIVIDDSDIAKPCSSKLEGLCKVKDGSTGEITDGYWYAGVSALTSKHKQPIPVYSRVYSTGETGYISNNAETIKSLEFLSKHFPATYIRALDRGYDAGYVFDYFMPRGENFIVRTVGNRNCIYKGKTILISELAKRFKGKYSLNFKAKGGKKVDCKISIVPVSLPKYPGKHLNLVICKGLCKDPLMLLTSLDSNDNRLSVTITKVYLMRWRIEEYYKFKKQGFGFEKFLVRSLKSIRNLDLLLTVAIGYIGTLSEKINESIEIMEVIEASKRLYGLSKFTFYAISDGLAAIFAKSYVGIRAFFRPPKPSTQLTLLGWA